MPLLGNVVISKFSYESPRSIYGETSNEGKKSASTYACSSLRGSVQENGVEGVVLVVIQITEDPSTERTAPPSSAHVQLDDIPRTPIQPSVEGEFRQHDGVVTMMMFYRRRLSTATILSRWIMVEAGTAHG